MRVSFAKFNKIYTTDNGVNSNLFNNLDVSRDTFAIIMNAIKDNKNNTSCCDLISYFYNLKKNNLKLKNIKYNEFIFFYYVMFELDILVFDDNNMIVYDNKSKLDKSSIYNFICEFLSKINKK